MEDSNIHNDLNTNDNTIINDIHDFSEEEVYRDMPNIVDHETSIDKSNETINNNKTNTKINKDDELPEDLFKYSFHNLYNKLIINDIPVAKMDPLPPRPSEEELRNRSIYKPPTAEQPIPCITKCPIKSYTTFKYPQNSQEITPKVVTNTVENIFESMRKMYNDIEIDIKDLENDKLRFSFIDKSKINSSIYGCYESIGSFSGVFQTFKSEDNQHYIGVFRRLCGDIISFNDKYRSFMDLLTSESEIKHVIN